MAERRLVTTWWPRLQLVRGKRLELTWDKLQERLRSPRHRLEVEADAENAAAWDAALNPHKKTLPCWAPAAFREDHRSSANVERLSCLVLDSDKGATVETLVVVFDRWANVIHTSARHRRQFTKARVVLPLTRDVTPEEHARLYAWAIAYAAGEGIELDQECADAHRDWFVPCEVNDIPFIGVPRNAPWLDPDAVLPRAPAPAPPAAAPSTPPSVPGAAPSARDRDQRRLTRWAEKMLGKQGEKIRDAGDGARHKVLLRAAFRVGQYFASCDLREESAVDALLSASLSAGLKREDAEDVIRRQLKAGKKKPKTPTLSDSAPKGHPPPPTSHGSNGPVDDAPSPFSGPPEPPWMKLLARDLHGKLITSDGNVLLVIENDPKIRECFAFDTHAGRMMWVRRPPWATPQDGAWPQPSSDHQMSRLSAWLERCYRLFPARTVVGQQVWTAAQRVVIDPVRDYLAGVQWDRTQRAGTWLSDYLGAEDTPFHRAVGERWLVSAVARIFEPGCKVDHTIVLEGPQGRRKSETLRVLGGPWFRDAHIDMTNKEGQVMLGGAWIQELGEFRSVRGATMEQAKQFLTWQSDVFRPPYGKEPVERPRRVAFAATVNDPEYLMDSTGNRRFWPVRCFVRFAYAKTVELAKVRDQLWAEAVALYRARMRWHFDEELDADLIAAASEAQEARRTQHPWEDLLADWRLDHEYVTTNDALQFLGVPMGERKMHHVQAVAAALRANGWEKRRTPLKLPGGGRRQVFVRGDRGDRAAHPDHTLITDPDHSQPTDQAQLL